MRNQFLVFLLMAVLAIASCDTSPTFKSDRKVFSFNTPDSVRILPIDLHEISGIVALSDSTAAAVQDELGVVFVYDLKLGEIISKINFAGPGDYEGVAAANDTLWVLRSDGMLFRIAHFVSKAAVDSVATGIPTRNNEGLCYDPVKKRLLIAAKSKMAKGREFKDKRIIYSIPVAGQSKAEQLFTIDVNHVIEVAKARGVDLPDLNKKGGEAQKSGLKFKMSELAIEPNTNRLFVLSAADHFLFTFSENGEIDEIHSLNPNLYNKPEGITFIAENLLVISNEGQKGKPTLIYLNNKTLE